MEKRESYSRVYYLLLFIGFSIVLGMGLVRAFLPILASDLDPSGTLVGYVVSAWFLARVFIELPSGLLSDRIGRRRLFVLGIALAAGGALLCATASSINSLIIGRALWGFGAALFFLNNTAMLIDVFAPEVRGRALGTFQGLEFVGSLIGAPIGAFIASLFGYFSPFYVTLALIIMSLLLALFSRELKTIGQSPVEPTIQVSLQDSVRSLMNWGIVVISLISFSRMLIMNGVMNAVFPIYLYEYLNFDLNLIGIVTGVRTAGFAAATIASGYLSDRMGRKPVILTGLLISAPCLYAYTIIQSLEIILPVGIFDGIGSGLVSSTLIVLLSDLVKPEFRGISIGLYRTFMDIGGVVGPIMFMLIVTSSSIFTPFLVGAVLLLIMAALTLTIRQGRH